ncbi:hypothetical protein G7K_5185-t1 [Saitoella complicata NRRL Y-17804]|uniref:Uncharacterized protein n=1 Tax=Saitoella complicata (strain BCRC 22490 / CBS 7301 / JCM 7358 / NBRC 10748 / NRRL Y-17804) TaxID=698492 RepID=A0A0E9NMP4_SAICN|nr:hypothetical protein G7K_5185-t1 [Saitoella complicata NRRL Y-17804]
MTLSSILHANAGLGVQHACLKLHPLSRSSGHLMVVINVLTQIHAGQRITTARVQTADLFEICVDVLNRFANKRGRVKTGCQDRCYCSSSRP